MTFRETEYPELLKSLLNLMKEFDDPFLFQAVFEEVYNTHSSIPLYPGIVQMCLEKLIKDKEEISQLRQGSRISIATSEGKVFGVLEKVQGDKVIIKNPVTVTESPVTEIDAKDIKKVRALSDGILKEIWPTLVFDSDKDE